MAIVVSDAEMKNRNLLDSFKPMHLIRITDKLSQVKYVMQLGKLASLGLLDQDSTL